MQQFQQKLVRFVWNFRVRTTGLSTRNGNLDRDVRSTRHYQFCERL